MLETHNALRIKRSKIPAHDGLFQDNQVAGSTVPHQPEQGTG